jgi:hypothetical protein
MQSAADSLAAMLARGSSPIYCSIIGCDRQAPGLPQMETFNELRICTPPARKDCVPRTDFNNDAAQDLAAQLATHIREQPRAIPRANDRLSL